MKRQKTLLSPGGWAALLLLLALGLWEATAAAGYVDPFFFSRPSLLWQEFWTMLHSGMLARHLSVTAQEAGLGLLLGGTLGTLAGLGLGLSPRVSRALMPLMTGLNGLPKLALGPLFIIWFGMGLSSKVLISALMVFLFLPSISTPASRVWTPPWWGRCACWAAPRDRSWERSSGPPACPGCSPVSAPVWACPFPAPLWGTIWALPAAWAGSSPQRGMCSTPRGSSAAC